MELPTQSLAFGTIAMGLFGGLALFLSGMEQMSQALKAVAGEGMRSVLANLTRNRFMAAGTGAFVTAVIQSSSVTTVLVVGFISAGIMTLTQSVGVIMGANIGTTITAQIVAFKVTKYALLLVAVGFSLDFFSKREKLRLYGSMLMGLGLVFFGMSLMSDATKPLRTFEPFIELMRSMDHPLLGILVAAAFTALVQSSSATTGIVIVLAGQGFITLEAGIALAFGANVGTCVTALLATLGKPRAAKQAALVHVLFNILGVLLWVAFIDDLARAVRAISPAAEGLDGGARLAAETPRQIANAHTAFNLANTALFIWFTGPLAALVQKILPIKPAVASTHATPKYLDPIYFETPAIALDRVRLELVRLGEGVQEMMKAAPLAIMGGGPESLARLSARSVQSTRLYEAIVGYLAQLSRLELGSDRTAVLARLTSVANTIDNVGDTIATNVVSLGHERLRAGIDPSAATVQAFQPLRDAVAQSFQQALASVRESDVKLAAQVVARKSEVQDLAREVNAHLARRVSADEPNRVVAFRIESDAVEIMQRLYYFAKRIAKDVIGAVEAAEELGPGAADQEPVEA